MDRRQALKLVGLAGAGVLTGVLAPGCAPAATQQPTNPASGATVTEVAPAPGFFTTRERRTVEVLVDDIIPRDHRSGSATDAKVPEFIEAMLGDTELAETPLTQTEIRGGLAWLDTECRRRFTRAYADCDEGERHQVLDDIAFPEKARPEMRYGAEFFIGMRNFTASGFYSSKMGYEDLRYMGNTFNPGYNGCPEAALARLGVSYAEWDARYSAREPGAGSA
jgi:gluconate 2-dehydrogenase gamma chain